MTAEVVSAAEIRQFSPFDSLPDEYIGKVVEKARRQRYDKGTLVFQRGKPLEDNYYLLQGQVELIDSSFERTLLSDSCGASNLSLCNSSPTKVSAVTKSDIELLLIERDFVDLVMAWSESGSMDQATPEDQSLQQASGNVHNHRVTVEDSHSDDWMSSLLQSPLLAQVPPAHIQQLFVAFESIKVQTGQQVIREGDEGDYFYVIEQGSARVTKPHSELNVSLQAGDFFGEEALVGETTRNATIEMLTDGALMRLDKDSFKRLLHEPVIHKVTIEDLQAFEGDYQLVDVRLPLEYRHGHFTDSQNIPLSSLRKRMQQLDHKRRYVVTDDGGRRSLVATHLLCQAGFEAVLLADVAQAYV